MFVAATSDGASVVWVEVIMEVRGSFDLAVRLLPPGAAVVGGSLCSAVMFGPAGGLLTLLASMAAIISSVFGSASWLTSGSFL